MVKYITKKTKHNTEFNLKLDNDKVMVKFKPTFTHDYIMVTEFLEKHRLTDHEKIVLMDGVYDLGFMLSYKPILKKR